MNDIVVIGGEIKLVNSIDGDCELLTTVNGTPGIFMAVTDFNYYTGAYEVTPSSETVILDTKNKMMSDNITVNPIPNNYGLITWNGSYLRIS